MNILVFAGTTEGRRLAEALAAMPVTATICVATEYGSDALGAMPDRFVVRVGRMDPDAMRDLMTGETFDLVVDATHPYAAQASANIRGSAAAAGLLYQRLLREKSADADCLHVPAAAEAAQALTRMDGPVFLATGTKDLVVFATVPNFAERMVVRVLPTVESIRACETLGFQRSRIVAMQGPFSRALNLALFREYGIRILVTKDGGAVGGFEEKIMAAADADAAVVVIGRPVEENGLGLAEVLAAIARRLEDRA